jgi:hypothetical protein
LVLCVIFLIFFDINENGVQGLAEPL